MRNLSALPGFATTPAHGVPQGTSHPALLSSGCAGRHCEAPRCFVSASRTDFSAGEDGVVYVAHGASPHTPGHPGLRDARHRNRSRVCSNTLAIQMETLAKTPAECTKRKCRRHGQP